MEGANPGLPLQSRPPSITEWSIDLHYGFPSSFPGRGVKSLRGLWPLSGQPQQSQVAPCARLPQEIWVSPSSVP